MTAILGFATGFGGPVWLAADGRSVSGECEPLVDERKLVAFAGGRVVVGGAGDRRAFDILCSSRAFEWDDLAATMDGDLGARVRRAVAELRTDLKAGGTVKSTDGGEEHCSGRFLIGVRGQLFVVGTDFGVLGVPRAAIGCGGQAALAAFLALGRGGGLSLDKHLRQALDIAADLDVHVGPPYTVLEVPA